MKSFNADVLGEVNLALSIALLLSMAVSIMTEASAAKFLSEYSSMSNRQRIFTMLQNWLLVGSLILVTGAYIFHTYILEQIKIGESLFLIDLLLVFLMAAHHFYRGCYYGLDSVDMFFKLELGSVLLFFLVLDLDIRTSGQNLLLPFLAYYGFFSIFSAIDLRKYCRPTGESFPLRRDIGKYGTIAMIGSLASTSSTYAATIITGFYLTTDQVGFYSAAVSITVVLIYAPTILGRVLLPTMSSFYGTGDIYRIKRLLNITTTWLFMIVLFLGGIFIILSKEILIILFNPSFAGATFSLQMLILSLCLAAMAVPAVNALSGTKYVMIPNVAGVIGFLMSLSIWPYIIPRFGINGTAFGYIMGSIATSIIILFYANKYYGLGLKKLLSISSVCISIFILANSITWLLPSYPDWIAAAIFTILFLISFRRDLYDLYGKMRTGLPIIDRHEHP